MDDEKFRSLIKSKCDLCFRKDAEEDACLLYAGRHAGVELCLGPFEDQEDRTEKVREEFAKEKKAKADLDRAIREVIKNSYIRKRKLFDD